MCPSVRTCVKEGCNLSRTSSISSLILGICKENNKEPRRKRKSAFSVTITRHYHLCAVILVCQVLSWFIILHLYLFLNGFTNTDSNTSLKCKRSKRVYSDNKKWKLEKQNITALLKLNSIWICSQWSPTLEFWTNGLMNRLSGPKLFSKYRRLIGIYK